MVSPASVFDSPSAEVTAARVRNLVADNPDETLTLEYKGQFTTKIVESVAAMANAYGGLILIGVAEKREGDRVVGVDPMTAIRIVDTCHESLEPPWVPEIIPVDMGDGVSVLVVRVDARQAPRPVLLRGRAPVRLHGRNAVADRARLAALFAEEPVLVGGSGWRIQPTQMPVDDAGQPTLDVLLGSGLVTPIGERASYRPMSERAVARLCDALNGSALGACLLRWLSGLGVSGFDPFHVEGFNRARRAQLRWSAPAGGERIPVSSSVAVRLPEPYGAAGGTLALAVEVALAIRPSKSDARLSVGTWRLPPTELDATVDSLVSALVDPAVVGAVAALADIDPVLVPQPVNVNFQAGVDVPDLLCLEGLRPIRDAGPSRGATLLVDPARDLRDPVERAEQLDAWLVQVALDAGLAGMEDLVPRLRAARQAEGPAAGSG